MNKSASKKSSYLGCVLLLLLTTIAAQLSAVAQTAEDQANREHALELYEQNKFTEAIPLLEKLVKVYPKDAVLWERLGWATFVVSASIKNKEERLAARAHARSSLLRAQELGDNSNLLHSGLQALAAPDLAAEGFSNDKAAEAAMREGEEAHTRGDLDKAIAAYQRALQYDPNLYIAALWTGDMYYKKGYQATNAGVRNEYLDKAGEWFSRAIAINENAETAYRYWGDALMLQGRPQEALPKFIEAIIAEPGNRNTYMGLSQWGERNKVSMAHPTIEVPVKVSVAGGKVNVDFDPRLRNSEDGSGAWENFGLVRGQWVEEGFTRAFPNEKAYRHTLREETEALRKTAEVASAWLKTGKVKSLSPSLAALVKLNDADLLEPFIFFTRVDEGISQDYPEYRRAHRDKLRLYWSKVVIAPR